MRRWESEGRITARCPPTGQRYFDDTDVRRVMDAIENGDIAVLVVARKDRLARFGLGYIEHVATRDGCQLIVASQESVSPRRELVEDLLAIARTFSCRRYGPRGCEKTPRSELTGGIR